MEKYYNPLYDQSYDSPLYDGRPKKIYMLCSTPRCGSTYFASLISQTKSLGSPYEYLADANFRMMQARFKTLDDNTTMKEIIRHRTSSFGIYGFKLHANQFPCLHYIQDLGDDYKIDHHVIIQRRDIVRQAISYAKAALSEEWILIDGYSSPNRKEILQEDLDIEGMINQINQENLDWVKHFSDNNIKPMIVFYEDLLARPQSEIDKLARWLNSPSGAVDPTQVPMKRQSNMITEKIMKNFVGKKS